METLVSVTCPIDIYAEERDNKKYLNYSNFVKKERKKSRNSKPELISKREAFALQSRVVHFIPRYFWMDTPPLEDAVNRHSTQKHRNILPATKSRLFAQMLLRVN